MSSVAPLEGIRVLEIGNMWAGPVVGTILRDFGAAVTRVEQPGLGDPMRHWPPFKNGVSLAFLRMNTDKRSVAVDLRNPEGQEIVQRLASKADVVVTNFRIPTLEKWGLTYKGLSRANAGLVFVRVSGFGKTGPYRDRPGFGTLGDAVSGFAYVNGWPDKPPLLAAFGLVDQVAAISGAFGAMMALYRRSLTGQGEEVDVAIYEPMMFLIGDVIVRYSTLGTIQERRGNKSETVSPRGVYLTKDDQWVVIAASSQSITERLFKVIDRVGALRDPRYATNDMRVLHDAEIQSWIKEWVRNRTRDDVLKTMEAYEVVAGPVMSAKDIVEDPHFQERTLVMVKSQLAGDFVMPGPIIHLTSYEGRQYSDPPQIGQHTDEVLRDELGLSDATIARLRDLKVVG